MWNTRRIRLSLIVACLGLVAAACSSTTDSESSGPTSTSATSTSAPESDAPLTSITFLMDFLVSGWHTPAYAGVSEGFFEDEGFDVTVQPGQGSVDGATKVAAGVAQFAQIDAASALRTISEGGDLLLIGVIDQAYPGGLCYLGEEHTINDFADLQGLKIAASEGDAYMVPLPGLVEAAGLDPSSYERVVMTPPNYTASLVAGQVDAYACSRATLIPGEVAVAAEGLTLKMFRYADTGFEPLGHMLVVNGEFGRQNPELVQNFVNAWALSHVWAWANPDQALADFGTINPDVDADIARATFLDRQKSYAAGDEFFTATPEKLQATVAFINGAYDAELDADSVYSSEFVDKLPESVRQGNLP